VLLAQLLRQVAQSGQATRAALVDGTGKARSTISSYVDQMLERGILVEYGSATSTGGRPALLLRINVKAGVILTADLGATAAKLAVTDLGGSVLASRTNMNFDIGDGPQRVLDWVDQQFCALLAEVERATDNVRAIAIGVPGPVEYGSGTVVRPPIMPGWDACRIPDFFAKDYAVPILVDNDVNLMALGEYHVRDVAEGCEFLFVKVGTGIGGGIISNGVLHRGAKGAAGDIGHIRVPNAEMACHCGHIGCLEAVAGGKALVKVLAKNGLDVRTSRDVARLALEGRLQARRAVRVASERIGEVLAGVVNFYNPALIVIGGSFAQLDELLLTGVRCGIDQRALPLAAGSLVIETSRLGYDAGTVGASKLARQHLFSSIRWVTAMLAISAANPLS
jgi:predicted NBD/HSP70 family sugar kinase